SSRVGANAADGTRSRRARPRPPRANLGASRVTIPPTDETRTAEPCRADRSPRPPCTTGRRTARRARRPPRDEQDAAEPGRTYLRPPSVQAGLTALATVTRYEVIGVEGIGEVRPGDDIARLIVEAAKRQGTPVVSGDLLVIGQKIVSKAEGRLVKLADIQPSAIAMEPGLAKDPRLVEVILRESRRVVRMDKGVLITETHHGWICANAGVDQSNVDADVVALLPEDSDRSARALRGRVRALAGVE